LLPILMQWLRLLLLRTFFFFTLDMKLLLFVCVAFISLGSQVGDCCWEVSGPGKVDLLQWVDSIIGSDFWVQWWKSCSYQRLADCFYWRWGWYDACRRWSQAVRSKNSNLGLLFFVWTRIDQQISFTIFVLEWYKTSVPIALVCPWMI